MKNILNILLLTMIVCCWSCSGGEDAPINPTPKPEENPKIEVTTTATVLAQEGGTASVSFTSSADWTIDVTEGRAVSWCTVSPTSGSKGTNSLTVTTTSNDTYDERNAKVTIKAGATSQSFTITQKQKDALVVTSNKVEIGCEGGNFSIETKTNVSVTYEIEEAAKDWISASESRSLTSKTLNFTAKANENIERRQGNIILKGDNGLTEIVTIYQAGEEVSFVLTTEKDMTIGSEGGTLKIELQSNTEIKMEGLDADWLRQSSSRSMSASTYYIEVDANDTYDERNAAITFTSGDKKQIVTVTQKQKDALIVTSNKVEIDADGGDFTIEAKANVSVTYEIEEATKDWISASESRGLTSKTLNFTAKANDNIERRQGNIILKGDNGLTETVIVYQEGEKPTLVITSDDIIIGSDGESVKIELKSNVDYTMVLPKVDWISQDDSRTISAYTHYLTVTPNESYDQRSAKIFFQNETEGLKDSISITQLQKDAIIVAKNEYTVASESGNLEFSVNTNVDFEMSVSVDWIKQNTRSRGLVEKSLSFTIAENESTKSRKGDIIITYQDLKQTIKVIQKGAFDNEAIERAALIEFYKATGGDNWTNNENWCSDKPLNEWYGVVTHKDGINTSRVISLELSSNQLSGSIPECIGCLTELESLRLGWNQLTGGLENLEDLIQLKNIYLYSNQLTGSIPENIGNLRALESLNLGSNQLTGSIPESLGNLTALTGLYLGNNQFTGELPESIGNLISLEGLDLSRNQLSGSIPGNIGNLTELEILYLDRNQLTGSIPESIGNLTKLTRLYLEVNQLTGGIIQNICNLIALEQLRLSWNQLTGSIPENIGNLTKLKELDLYNNRLTGSIPESIANLKILEVLDLGYNQLSGSIPQWICNLTTLTDLVLSENQLTGPIPENIGNLTKLTRLYLANNQLTGPIPESIGYLTELVRLPLENNQLTGSIPESFGNLTKLEGLWLQNNMLSGKIPASIAKLNVWKDRWVDVIMGNLGLDIEGVPIPAPDFSVTDIYGNPIISENEYNKNKMTIIYDWGTWCPFSNAFNPTLIQLYETYHQYGLEIIGSCELSTASTAEETKTHIEKNSIPWKNFVTKAGNEIGIFHLVNTVPSVVVVDNKKQVIFQSIRYGDYCNLPDIVKNYFGTALDTEKGTGAEIEPGGGIEEG